MLITLPRVGKAGADPGYFVGGMWLVQNSQVAPTWSRDMPHGQKEQNSILSNGKSKKYALLFSE